jgi:hypothetical protein
MSISENAVRFTPSIIPTVVCGVPPEDEQVMLETRRGP